MGQSSSSLVLSAIKTEGSLDCDDPTNQDLLLQQFRERIDKSSQQDKLSKFCMDAGFIRVVEVGQYFMTKDSGDCRLFRSVACREYTLPRNDPASTTTRMDSRKLENWACIQNLRPVVQYGKHWIEIRIWSVAQDNSQSWFRISYGTIKYVIDSNQNNTEILSDPQEDQETTTERTCWYTNYHTDARKKMDWYWAIRTNSRCVRSLEESDQYSSTQSNSTAGRWWSNSILQNQIPSSKSLISQVQHWSDDRRKAFLAVGGGSTRRYQYCSDNSGRILYLRALQGTLWK